MRIIKRRRIKPFPNKKYNIIYADPPWSFGNRMYSSNKNDHHRSIMRAYSVMKTKNISLLDVKSITKKMQYVLCGQPMHISLMRLG